MRYSNGKVLILRVMTFARRSVSPPSFFLGQACCAAGRILRTYRRHALVFLLCTLSWHVAWSQSTIAYTAGPPFQIPMDYAQAYLDLDHNDSPELSFDGGGALCTTDIPVSLCTVSASVTSIGTNSLLTQNHSPLILSAGEWIGPAGTSNSVWSAGNTATLLTFWWSGRSQTSGKSGPLAQVDEGYLGARFWAEGRLYYGWVHLTAASPFPGPTVLDWAYETRAGVPIRAGAKPVSVQLSSPLVVRPGYFRLSAATEIGKTYRVQVKPHLEAFPWSSLGFLLPATTTNLLVELPMSAPAQFFRIVEED